MLDINPESDLLREIKDILDEFHIITNIKKKQERVFKQFREHLKHILAPTLAESRELETAKPMRVEAKHPGLEGNNGTSNPKEAEKRRAEREIANRDAKWTLESGTNFFSGLMDRLTDLGNLKESAENTEKAVLPPSVLLALPSYFCFWSES